MNILKNFLPISVLILVVGCATETVSLDNSAELKTFDRKFFENDSAEVHLPSGGKWKYDDETAKKKTIATCIVSVKDSGEAKQIPDSVRDFMQNEMAAVKQFNVVALTGTDADFVVDEHADVGTQVARKEQRGDVVVDLGITLRANWTRQEANVGNGLHQVIYSFNGNATCKDQETGLVNSDLSKPVEGHDSRKVHYDLTGNVSGGFDPDKKGAEVEPLRTAAMRALYPYFNLLGNYYPVAGKIVATDRVGGAFTLNRGSDDGVGAEQQFVVFVEEDGMKTALAYAEGRPEAKKTTLTCYRWAETDAAESYIKEFRNNPKKFVKEYALGAVALGMAMSESWKQMLFGTNKALRDAIQ